MEIPTLRMAKTVSVKTGDTVVTDGPYIEAKEYLGVVRGIINSPNAVVDLRITGAAEYFDALDTQLARAVAGEAKPQEALDEAAKQWNSITDRLGRDQQKKQYRQMLGLPTS